MIEYNYAKANHINKASDTEALFLDINQSIFSGIMTYKVFDKQDNFDFIINLIINALN